MITVEPSPWPAAAVKQRAARRRRARRLAATLPVVAAVAGCAVVMAAVNRDRAPGAPTLPAASTSPPAPSHPAATRAPTVRVVPAGRPFAVGDGERMKLEPTLRCLAQGSDVWQCEKVADGNRAAGSVSSQNRADQDATVYAPLYVGPVLPARMTVTVQGHSYPVQMVALRGHPGYASGYVVGPPPPSPGVFPQLTVRAYDARGTVIASIVSPASTHSSSGSGP